MMQDIRLGFRILKYGMSLTSSVIVGTLFMIMAFLMDIIVYGGPMGSIYVGIVVVFLAQLLHSVIQSTMVQSSPQKKRLATKIPALMITVVLLVYHSVIIVFKCIKVANQPEDEFAVAYGIVVGSIGILIILVYFSFAMKEYWISTILFFVVFYTFFVGANVFGGSNMFVDLVVFHLNIPMVIAVPVSYASILTGGGIHYAVNVWLYKKDYAPQNFKRALERAK